VVRLGGRADLPVRLSVRSMGCLVDACYA